MPHIPDHLTHDPELVAAYAAGDATGPDLAAATELVAACTECAELHRDLRAIATALPELPVPARTRDFRLTPEQAASLAPSGWRGVLAAFASPRFRLAAPLGTGLAAAGLAGLLLATPGGLIPAATSTSGAATTTERSDKDAGLPGDSGAGFYAPAASAAAASMIPEGMASAAASEAAAAAPVEGQPGGDPEIQAAGPAEGASPDGGGAAAGAQPASSPDRELVAQATSPASVPTDAAAGGVQAATPSTGATPLLIVSAALLLAGVVLLVLRLAAGSLSRP